MGNDSTPDGPRFFTTTEVARYCAVSNDGVLRWIKSGKLRAFATPGGHYRIESEEFRAFLERYDIPIDESFFSGVTRPRSVLVVDDDPDIRALVRRALEALGADLHIEEASDGYEAGIKIGARRPDLVVLDVMMPEVDGFSLCRSMRANPETRSIRVLAITGHREGDTIARMYEAGADLCLAKPLELTRLRLEAARLLDEARGRGRANTPGG